MTRSTTFRLVALAAAVSASLIAPSAFAASTATVNMTVSATVLKVCRIAVTQQMAFGNIDPSTVAVAPTATGIVTYQCTAGTAMSSITVDGAATGTTVTMTDGGSNNLPATVSWPASLATGAGFAGTDASLTLTGTIALATAQGAAAAAYSKQVAVAFNY